jgi:predicted permease
LLQLMLELLPCLGFGLLFGWHRPLWPERLAPPLVRFGVPLSIAGLVLRSGVHWDVVGAALLTLGLIGSSLLLLHWPGWRGWLPWGVTRLGAVTGNTGYFGVPVVLALLPPGGLAFAVIYDIVGSLITWTVGPPLISGARFSGGSLMGHLGRSPSVQGMALAVVVQLTPVAPLMASSLWWPARAVIVLALLLLGMRLGVMLRSGEVNGKALQVLRPALLAKLLLLPALMWALAVLTAQPALVRDVLVLQAATPTAISVLLIAETSARDVSEAAGLVFASTLLALITVPLWWVLLQAVG